MEEKLTLEQILSCNDRELDALTVEYVTHESTCPWHGALPADNIPHYSTDKELARLLLRRWIQTNQEFEKSHLNVWDENNETKYSVSINHNEYGVIAKYTDTDLARAICVALILAEQEK